MTLTQGQMVGSGRSQPNADQRRGVREADADQAGGADGDTVAGEEHRAVGLDLGVAPDGSDHPLGRLAPTRGPVHGGRRRAG